MVSSLKKVSLHFTIDSMTLPELMANVKQAHTPEAETHIVDFIFDIKKWIEPCLKV